MRMQRRRPTQRLAFEELEQRSMLAASGLGVLSGFGGGFPTDPTPTSPSTIPAVIGTVVPGSSGGVMLFGPAALATATGGASSQIANGLSASAIFNGGVVAGTVSAGAQVGATAGVTANPFAETGGVSTRFDATSGNGQITLTTGAGTPGISSFALPTNAVADN